MSWDKITATPSTSLRSSGEAVQECNETAKTATGASASRLSSVAGKAPLSTSPQSGKAAGAANARERAKALLSGKVKELTVHPFDYSAGDRRGDYSYLTPQEAVGRLCDKLTDHTDELQGQPLSAVSILILGTDFLPFYEALDAFNKVFPVTGLEEAQRRAVRLASLEELKLIREGGGITPRWRQSSPAHYGTPAALDMGLGRVLATAEGYHAETTSPEAELTALINKKRDQIDARQAAWDALNAMLKGEIAMGLYEEGTTSEIKEAILGHALPPGAYKLSAAVCWVGSPDSITLFKEIFGL